MKDTDLIFGLMATFGKKEYSIAQLNHLLNPFNVTEISLRTTLSRMSRNDIVASRKEGKTVYYSFHKKGERIKLLGAMSFSIPDWSDWDNDWWGIAFSVPETKKEFRYQIRKKLTAYRFVLLFPGFWIRPYNKTEESFFNFNDPLIKEHCKVLIYKEFFEIKNKSIGDLWKINKINNNLHKGIDKIREISNIKAELSPELSLIYKMRIGNEIIKLLISDPVLPQQFLPDNWIGVEIRKEFFLLDKELTEISKSYWNQIFT